MYDAVFSRKISISKQFLKKRAIPETEITSFKLVLQFSREIVAGKVQSSFRFVVSTQTVLKIYFEIEMDQPMEGPVLIRLDGLWLVAGVICCFAAGLAFGLDVGLAFGLDVGSYNGFAAGLVVGYAFGQHQQQMDQQQMDQQQQQQDGSS